MEKQAKTKKKYFICSDIHGFYDEWMASLKAAGYSKKDPSHILVILGDIFDRGPKPYEIFSFLKRLPKRRKVLINGNHEQLLKELVFRRCPYQHDVHNGTFSTLLTLCPEYEPSIENFRAEHPYPKDNPELVEEWRKSNRAFFDAMDEKLYANEKINEIMDWLLSEEWIDFLETKHHIFVHAFIPLLDFHGEEIYMPSWSQASHKEWQDAAWGCPWDKYKKGLFVEEERKGKVLVCGHWHTSDFYNNLDFADSPTKMSIRENPIYRSKDYPGLIGLDACTALTHKVNVLVLGEDEI